MRLWVIAYDIADDRRRRRLVAVLARRAARVQESVFEAWLNAADIRALLAEAAAEIEPGADALRAYPSAQREAGRHLCLGDQPGAERLAGHWIV
jgi:CRISPR-associated protein Cas2